MIALFVRLVIETAFYIQLFGDAMVDNRPNMYSRQCSAHGKLSVHAICFRSVAGPRHRTCSISSPSSCLLRLSLQAHIVTRNGGLHWVKKCFACFWETSGHVA